MSETEYEVGCSCKKDLNQILKIGSDCSKVKKSQLWSSLEVLFLNTDNLESDSNLEYNGMTVTTCGNRERSEFQRDIMK